MTVSRRSALLALGALPFAVLPRVGVFDEAGQEWLASIEHASGGRLGVAILEVESGRLVSHRGDERFPMCSTFKLLAAAAVLAWVDRGKETLDRRIPFGRADLLEYAPATAPRVAEGTMTLEELCEAAMVVSDNTAANLILGTIGGPAGLTSYIRSLGDTVTRLDRVEPALNEAAPGDPRDTTTPVAMARDLHRLVTQDALSRASRERLTSWLLGNKTGASRLRAGFPSDWRVGEKTGTGNRGTTNDVGVAWPPNRPPVITAAYLTESEAPAEAREKTLADVARGIAAAKHFQAALQG